MSHRTGKIEVIGRTNGYVFMHYHRAAELRDRGRFMVFKSNPEACWFDDYTEMVTDYTVGAPTGFTIEDGLLASEQAETPVLN